MLSRADLVAWVEIRHGRKHAEKRVSDGGFAFWIDTQPDAFHDGDQFAMTYGNGPSVAVKATGHVWHLASNPDSVPVYDARSEDDLKARLREAHYDPDTPDEILGEDRTELPDPAPRAIIWHEVIRWLARIGWQEPAYELVDRRYAIAVMPTPAVKHNGPFFVIKRTAGVWYLGTAPEVLAAVDDARTEAEFYAALRSVIPDADPRVPHDRIPERFVDPYR
jgi:hypothetical protein